METLSTWNDARDVSKQQSSASGDEAILAVLGGDKESESSRSVSGNGQDKEGRLGGWSRLSTLGGGLRA